MSQAAGPTIAAAVPEAVLADPPADGVLVFAPTRVAVAAGFEVGDVLVRLQGIRTATVAAFEAAFLVKADGPVDHEVVRDGRTTVVAADRFAVSHGGYVGVRAGVAVEVRPAATVDGAALLRRASPVDLELQRRSNAFGQKAVGSVKGTERHRLAVADGILTLSSSLDFDEFGPNHATVESATSVLADGSLGLVSATWTDHVREAVVVSRPGHDGLPGIEWHARPPDGPVVVGRSAAGAVPSLLAPLLALFLEPLAGAAVHVTPVPEDGYPLWQVPSRSSFFPLDPTPLPSTLVCAGPDRCRVGRRQVPSLRFDRVALGRVWASTWVDLDGRLVSTRRASTTLANVDHV